MSNVVNQSRGNGRFAHLVKHDVDQEIMKVINRHISDVEVREMNQLHHTDENCLANTEKKSMYLGNLKVTRIRYEGARHRFQFYIDVKGNMVNSYTREHKTSNGKWELSSSTDYNDGLRDGYSIDFYTVYADGDHSVKLSVYVKQFFKKGKRVAVMYHRKDDDKIIAERKF